VVEATKETLNQPKPTPQTVYTMSLALDQTKTFLHELYNGPRLKPLSVWKTGQSSVTRKFQEVKLNLQLNLGESRVLF